MAQQIYINGEFFSKEDAKISVYDHGLLYGDGVFEGMRIYSGKVFRLQEHLIRLWESSLSIGLQIPISIEQLTADVNLCVSKNKLDDGYIRLVVTRGSGSLGIDPNRCSNPQIIIIVDKITLYPSELYENGLELVTASTIRNHPAALSPRIKSLNYLNNVLAKMEGLKAELPRSGDAEPQRRCRRMHRRQHLHRQKWPTANAADRRWDPGGDHTQCRVGTGACSRHTNDRDKSFSARHLHRRRMFFDRQRRRSDRRRPTR